MRGSTSCCRASWSAGEIARPPRLLESTAMLRLARERAASVPRVVESVALFDVTQDQALMTARRRSNASTGLFAGP